LVPRSVNWHLSQSFYRLIAHYSVYAMKESAMIVYEFCKSDGIFEFLLRILVSLVMEEKWEKK